MSAIRAAQPKRGRLGVYQDGPFRLVPTESGTVLAPDPVDAPFLQFVREVASGFDSLVLFARVVSSGTAEPTVVLPPSVEVVRLPDYGNLRQFPSVFRAAFGTGVSFWRGLRTVDIVWAFGPHPFELLLVVLARLRRKRVVIGVRQDTLAYFGARLPSRRWAPVLAVVRFLDVLHRLLARRIPATVVGTANVRRYSAGRSKVLSMTPSLVRERDVVDQPPARDWSGALDLLTVGRIDTEKNPLLLVDALAALEGEHPGRFRLRWVGDGPLAEAVRRRAAECGVEDRVVMLGYVPFGPSLLSLYRGAHVFVHVSLTEGVPQVLSEALASAIPVVATDVGGVRVALDDGQAGLLVPPSNLAALTSAIVRLSQDEPLRSRLVVRGLELARDRTLEAEAGRVAAFLHRP